MPTTSPKPLDRLRDLDAAVASAQARLDRVPDEERAAVVALRDAESAYAAAFATGTPSSSVEAKLRAARDDAQAVVNRPWEAIGQHAETAVVEAQSARAALVRAEPVAMINAFREEAADAAADVERTARALEDAVATHEAAHKAALRRRGAVAAQMYAALFPAGIRRVPGASWLKTDGLPSDLALWEWAYERGLTSTVPPGRQGDRPDSGLSNAERKAQRQREAAAAIAEAGIR